jgi:hypothetical protein
MMATIDSRSYVSGKFVLNLAGVQAGFVKSVEGGAVFADVVSEPPGADYYSRKHIGTPKFEALTVKVGLSMSSIIYDWIASSWQLSNLRKDGSITACDYNLEAQSERQFFHALISEVTIPAMDGADRNPAYLTIKLEPERVQYQKKSGKVSGDLTGRAQQQKVWTLNNFRLEIDGLDCSKVNKVDAFTVKVGMATDEVGETRSYQKAPATIEFPNLRITFAEASAQPWIDWHDSFVVRGNSDQSNEKNGALIFLSPNLATELGRINFFNLGIFRLSLDDDQSGESIKRATAELYCERMEFKYGSK